MDPGGGGIWGRKVGGKMRGQLEGMSVVVAAAEMGLFWGDLSRTLSRTLSGRD